MQHTLKNNLRLTIYVIICIVMDQLSKTLIYNCLQSSPKMLNILPFCNIIINWNYGVSFGILNDIEQSQDILSAVAIFIIFGLLVWYQKSKQKKELMLAVSFITGGALGNIIDRYRYGAVLDFIDLHISSFHYPAFNVADTLIFFGVLSIIFVAKKHNL